MRRVLEKITEFVVSTLYLAKWVIRKVVKGDFARLKKRVRQQLPIRVLGNGPSLQGLVTEFCDRDGYAVCCVNYSPLSELFFTIRPEYYVTVDPGVFESNSRNEELYKRLSEVDWAMVWFVPSAYRKMVMRRFAGNKNIHVEGHPMGLYLEMRIATLRHSLMKSGMASPPAQNVVIAALYDMMMCGFERLELYGVEHSWLQQMAVNDNNEVCLRDPHYYDKGVVELKPWVAIDGKVYTMHSVLRDLAAMFEGYHDVADFANYLGGVEIVNKTPNSFIDAFRREV